MNPCAVRYEPNYKWLYLPEVTRPDTCSKATEEFLQKTSLGLMQVMGAVYREYGYKGWLTALINDVDSQLWFGCKHLASKITKYGLEDGLSAYNAGRPIRGNAQYVEGVLQCASEWEKYHG